MFTLIHELTLLHTNYIGKASFVAAVTPGDVSNSALDAVSRRRIRIAPPPPPPRPNVPVHFKSPPLPRPPPLLSPLPPPPPPPPSPSPSPFSSNIDEAMRDYDMGTNPDLTVRAWTALAQICPFDADEITRASTHPFDDDGYIGYNPRLPSRRFNESYFVAADDEHYTAVADPPYHGDE
ncbi:hypothetical protein F0562_027813 [Nyssa sinensis]|uniref:Uncharacterized protein n=1 Tax=Nyssa sinensis TaxID=561372 RepID=A0A5J5B754_9ASTE|nr:hypothetical protein F0562_027813 [Nyssa sinensis]